MNQPAEQKQPRYVVCNCQHCDGRIEFDANEFIEKLLDPSWVPIGVGESYLRSTE